MPCCRGAGATMQTDAFYEQLVKALYTSGYRFAARDFQGEGLKSDNDATSTSIRVLAKLAPKLIGAVTGASVPDGITDIAPVFDKDGVQRSLDGVRSYSTLVGFKYLLAQPIIVAALPGDGVSDADMLAKTKLFDDAIQGMRKFTGKMNGVSLSVTGIMLWVFFEPGQAEAFRARVQEQCKVWRFWAKTWVISWAVDVPGRKVMAHQGMPIIVPQILNSGALTRSTFE
jgi:hypothetical protein